MNKHTILITTLALLIALMPMGAGAQQEEITCQSDYIVQAGDWLSKIAEKEYGNVLAYPTIVEATNAKAAQDDSYVAIETPDLIEPGWKLCIPSQVAAEGMTTETTNSPTMTSETLMNATYLTDGMEGGQITFTDGKYEGEPESEGSAVRPTAEILPPGAMGDVNGDGVDEAAVVFTYNGGGSGNFRYLAVMGNIETTPQTLAVLMLGDRVQVKDVAIDNGTVKVHMIRHGMGDGQCCPSEEAIVPYTLQGDTLVEGEAQIITPARGATETAAATDSYAFSPVGTVSPVACPAHVNYAAMLENEVEGETYECGLVAVPENHANPNGRTIELLYLRLFSPSDSPAPDPLLYLSGGPGASGLSEFNMVEQPDLASNMQLIRQNRDVVVYDQRGTGYSSPILCGPAQALLGSAVELLPDVTEEEVANIEADGHKAEAFNYGLCAMVYSDAAQVDLSQYNTLASAWDMAGLMTALGYDQYNLYGTSYGTKLAQVAVSETPDRVRTIAIDGIVPLDNDVMAASGIEFAEQYTHIFEQCAQNAACNEAYPNLPERFTALLDTIKENPIVLDEPIVPTGKMAVVVGLVSPQLAQTGFSQIDPLFWTLLTKINNTVPNNSYPQLSIAPYIPRMIVAAEEGDIDYIRSIFTDDSFAQDTEAVKAVHTVKDEQAIVPDNNFIAASVKALLAEANATVSNPTTPAAQWVALIFNHLNQRLADGEPQAEIVNDMINLTTLPYLGLDKQLLIDYANQYLPEAVAVEANAIAQPMTNADVRAVMWHIYDVAAAMSFTGEQVTGVHSGFTFAVNCAEDVNLRSAAAIDEAVAASAFPQMSLFGPERWSFFELLCSYFPADPAITTDFRNLLVSDVPALLIQGQMDTQTPFSDALDTAKNLSNATLVTFESEGHVVAGKTGSCPGSIAAQFLNNPTGEIDTSCADAFVVNYVLPE